MRTWLSGCLFTTLALAFAASQAVAAAPAPAVQEWDLITPNGVIEKAVSKPAPRISTLEGKTIALRWNGKHNGNVVLDRLAELLGQKFPTAKIVKTYANDQSLNKISGSEAEADRITKVIASVKPDIIIASQAD
jgi:hypothetical protein